MINEDGRYYLGQFKNGKMHAKGVFFDKSGKVNYIGIWEYDNPEDGKLLTTHLGETYIGNTKTGLPNGKGKLYKIGNLLYEGDWINGKMEGFGKIYKDNNYYIGNIKNDLPNGKGKLYKNGNL